MVAREQQHTSGAGLSASKASTKKRLCKVASFVAQPSEFALCRRCLYQCLLPQIPQMSLGNDYVTLKKSCGPSVSLSD